VSVRIVREREYEPRRRRLERTSSGGVRIFFSQLNYPHPFSRSKLKLMNHPSSIPLPVDHDGDIQEHPPPQETRTIQQEQDTPLFRSASMIQRQGSYDPTLTPTTITTNAPLVSTPDPQDPLHPGNPNSTRSHTPTLSLLSAESGSISAAFQSSPVTAHWLSHPLPSIPHYYPLEGTHVRIPMTAAAAEESSTTATTTTTTTLECLVSALTNCFRHLSIQAAYVQDDHHKTVQLWTQDHINMQIHLWNSQKKNNKHKDDKDDNNIQIQHDSTTSLIVEIQRRQGCSMVFHRYANVLLNTILMATTTNMDPVHVTCLRQQSVIHVEDITTLKKGIETQETLLLPQHQDDVVTTTTTTKDHHGKVHTARAFLKYKPKKRGDQVEFVQGLHELKTSVYEVLIYCPTWKRYIQLADPLQLVILKRFRRQGVRTTNVSSHPPTDDTLHQEIQVFQDHLRGSQPQVNDHSLSSPPPPPSNNNKSGIDGIMYNHTFLYAVLPIRTTPSTASGSSSCHTPTD